MEVDPARIWYSQPSISDKFSDGTPISKTLREVLANPEKLALLPLIDVCDHQRVRGGVNGQYMACTGNRRLFIFKVLKTLGKLRTVRVRFGTYVSKLMSQKSARKLFRPAAYDY